MGVSSAMYSSHAPATSIRQPCHVNIEDLVPRKVYVWFTASSVPKISAVPERIFEVISFVMMLDLFPNLNLYALPVCDFEAPF
jgi:hypothetical protein